jgi:hypothetical protein
VLASLIEVVGELDQREVLLLEPQLLDDPHQSGFPAVQPVLEGGFVVEGLSLHDILELLLALQLLLLQILNTLLYFADLQLVPLHLAPLLRMYIPGVCWAVDWVHEALNSGFL